MISTPLLIVGGGPVGLACSLLASRAGLPSVLVERNPETSTVPRATHVSRRSMEIFRGAGLEPAIRRAGFEVLPHGDPRPAREPLTTMPRTVVGVSTLAGIDDAEVLETGDEELAVPGPCPPFWLGQDRLEPLLRSAADEAAHSPARDTGAGGASRGTANLATGSQLRFGHELVSLEIADGGARAVVAGPDGEVVVHTRWVIAADGARGGVLRDLGAARHGLGVVGHRATVLFRAPGLERLVEGRRFFMSMIENPAFSGAIMQLNTPGRWAAAIPYDPDHGACADDFTPERCHELLRAAIGDDGIDVELEGVFHWRATHRMYRSYRHGPVFAVGDAAHLHPPAGGFGSNLGFADAHNLVWKLAAVHTGWAGEGLLDSYDAERRPVAEATAEQSLLIDGHGDELPGVEPCDMRTLIMGYSYAPGEPAFPPGFELDGRPGTRVPGHEVTPEGGFPSSLIDLCQSTFTLVTSDPQWEGPVRDAAARLGVPLRCVVAPEAPGTLLVRPDGFVADRLTDASARSNPSDRTGTLTTTLRRALARPEPMAQAVPRSANRSPVGRSRRRAGLMLSW